MSDTRKTAADAALPGERGRDLQKVNERLKELVASLRTEKDRLSVEARQLGSLAPVPAAHAVAAAPAAAPAVSADDERKRLAAELALAREAADHGHAERERLRARVAELEADNQRLSDDYVAVEDRTTDLAQRYVALERIHGNLSRGETLAAIQEIVINVVGSEELAVLERRGDALVLAQSFGVDPEPLRSLRVGDGAIGRAAATGRLYVAGREGPPAAGEEDLTAAIPLRVGDDVEGVVAVFRLLGHKPGLGEADQAVFDLLAAHAGVALRLRRTADAR